MWHKCECDTYISPSLQKARLNNERKNLNITREGIRMKHIMLQRAQESENAEEKAKEEASDKDAKNKGRKTTGKKKKWLTQTYKDVVSNIHVHGGHNVQLIGFNKLIAGY